MMRRKLHSEFTALSSVALMLHARTHRAAKETQESIPERALLARNNITHGNVQYDATRYRSIREALASNAAVAKITDFGMATKLGDVQSHVSHVRQGTPFYISPEVRPLHLFTIVMFCACEHVRGLGVGYACVQNGSVHRAHTRLSTGLWRFELQRACASVRARHLTLVLDMHKCAHQAHICRTQQIQNRCNWCRRCLQTARQHQLHQASDVYAFGVTMWELMRGHAVYVRRCAPCHRCHRLSELHLLALRAVLHLIMRRCLALEGGAKRWCVCVFVLRCSTRVRAHLVALAS